MTPEGVIETWSARARLWPAIVTVLLPYAFIALVFAPTVGHLLGEPDWTRLAGLTISDAALDRFAVGVEGLFLFGIASSFLRGMAIVAVCLAAFVLRERLGTRAGLTIVGAILVLSLGTFVVAYQTTAGAPSAGGPLAGYMRPVLRIVFETARGHGVDPAVSDRELDVAVLLNILALTAGFNTLLAAFAAVAVRTPVGEHAERHVRARGQALEWLALATAALLVLVTAVNKALIAWPQALVAAADQEVYGHIASAITTYWGAYGTALIVCAVVPPFFSLAADASLLARRAVGEGAAAQDEWRAAQGLHFDLKSGVVGGLTAAAPLLTGPGIDLLDRLLG